MSEKIWIFGDSWAALSYNNANIESWPIMIAKKYTVNNFAIAGSGPEYSLSTLIKNMNTATDSELKNTSVFFIISHSMRFNLDLTDPWHQVLFKYPTFDIFDSRVTPYVKNKLKLVLSKEHQKFIKLFYKYYFSTLTKQIHLLKTLGTLQLLSGRFKKMVVVSSFDSIPENIPLKHDNFCLFSRNPLSDLMVKTYPFDSDIRSNHLENSQHPVFLQELLNIITTELDVDFEKIKNAIV